jgi:hypothetical protein
VEGESAFGYLNSGRTPRAVVPKGNRSPPRLAAALISHRCANAASRSGPWMTGNQSLAPNHGGVGRGCGVGRGRGVARGVAVGGGVGVTLGVAVGVTVTVGVGVGVVGVAVGVAVGVGVGVVGVGVGVGVGVPPAAQKISIEASGAPPLS